MKTIAQQLNIKEFPFEIKDKNGKKIYSETSNGFWYKREYDSNGNPTYYEDSGGIWYKWEYDYNGNLIRHETSDGYRCKSEYDSNGNRTYYENSNGLWYKWEYDSNGNEIYRENSKGIIFDNRPKPVIELTLEDIAKMKGVSVSQIRIKE
jgi:YD repeat-containing protein